MDAVWRIFIAFDGAGTDFTGNGGCTFSKDGGNLLEGYALPQLLFNQHTFQIGKVLVFSHG
jgi:hypothetical protein